MMLSRLRTRGSSRVQVVSSGISWRDIAGSIPSPSAGGDSEQAIAHDMLMRSIIRRDVENVRYWVRAASDQRDLFRRCNQEGYTAATLTAAKGFESVLYTLMRLGSHLNELDGRGRTPFYVACFHGRIDVIDMLLASPKALKQVDTLLKCGETPLYAASRMGHVDVVRELLRLKRSVDPMQRVEGGWFPLLTACSEGHLKVVSLLLKDRRVRVNDCNDEGLTPLMAAATRGDKAIVQLLLKVKGIEVGATMAVGGGLERSAWDFASLMQHKTVARLLETKRPRPQRRASVETRPDFAGWEIKGAHCTTPIPKLSLRLPKRAWGEVSAQGAPAPSPIHAPDSTQPKPSK